MPSHDDIRSGHGWFDSNINCFYNYLENLDEEIVVKMDFGESECIFHESCLTTRIEERINEYIEWFIFKEHRRALDENDSLPDSFEDDIYGYVYYHICRYIQQKPSWYELKSTLPQE